MPTHPGHFTVVLPPLFAAPFRANLTDASDFVHIMQVEVLMVGSFFFLGKGLGFFAFGCQPN
jgi:hypothetical protein